MRLANGIYWKYLDAENSEIIWNKRIIIGPGDITLKCSKNYIYGMFNKNHKSLFFIIDLSKQKLIKDPSIHKIVNEYRIKVNFNDWYNHIEIFGAFKSQKQIEELKKELLKLN